MAKLFEISQLAGGTLLNEKPNFPRFQRKSSWTDLQRFKFTLSVFKGYPLGTVVTKQGMVELNAVGHEKEKMFILDGRQRYETLREMSNPETTWLWARAALTRLSSRTSPLEMQEKFKEFVDDYFYGTEDWESASSVSDWGSADAAAGEDDEAETSITDLGAGGAPLLDPVAYGDLDTLLKTLIMVGGVTSKQSGFRRLFDFRKSVEDLPFVKAGNLPETKSILAWLRYQDDQSGTSYAPSRDQFQEWLEASGTVASPKKLDAQLNATWPQVLNAVYLVGELQNRVTSAEFGHIQLLERATAEDEKKVFEIINAEGTTLTMAEILSATPTWNILVEPPAESRAALVADAKDLHGALGVDGFDGTIRRWDIAATLLDRIQAPLVLGAPDTWAWTHLVGTADKKFNRKITLGFRAISGWHQGNLQKSGVERLADDAALAKNVPPLKPYDWAERDFEQLATAAQRMIGKLWLFQKLRAWNFNLADRTSDAVALNFLLLTAIDYSAKGRPVGDAPGGQAAAFKKNAIALFDRSIFEYVTREWKGSGDSKIARNLSAARNGDLDLFRPVESAKWDGLVDELLSGQIRGVPYTKKAVDPRLRLLLTYAASLMNVVPFEPEEGEIDHIIPQGLLNAAHDSQADVDMYNLGNLALLRQADNLQKTSRSLPDIADNALAERLAEHTRIPVGDFPRFTTLGNLHSLVKSRGEIFRTVFGELRASFLDDPEHYIPKQEGVIKALWVQTSGKSPLDLIGQYESKSLEYKSSARWSHIQGAKEKTSELEVIRSVAGFLNADGGTLMLGVNDDGEPVGLDDDFKNLKQVHPGRDGYANWLTQRLKERLGGAVMMHVEIGFLTVDEMDICAVQVDSSPEPVYVDERDFYCRMTNTTQMLVGPELNKYIAKRFQRLG